jgi:hypothetical protein
MKIRIEARPGELQERLGDVVRLLEQVGLEKALPGIPESHTDQEPRPLDYKVLQAAVARANQRQVTRICRLMDERIAKILKG